MNIREYIPKGLSDRELRYFVEKANLEDDEPIICLLDGRGYFIPLPSERDLVWQYVASETSRVNKLSKKLRKMREWLSNQGQYEMEF